MAPMRLWSAVRRVARLANVMCGIAGVLGEPARIAERSVLQHRGPDSAGDWHNADLHLYHWRLAVIDLSVAGHQPMSDRSGRFVICFNGEIYNFQSLRSEVAAALAEQGQPICWRGHSDTEVIVEGFAAEGVRFFSKLNGMFALALYDQQEQRLYLTRDRAGIKPLYLWQCNDELAFASEAKFFHAVQGFVAKVHPPGLKSFLLYGHGFGQNRVLKQVRQLQPGELLEIEVGTRRCVSRSIVAPDLEVSVTPAGKRTRQSAPAELKAILLRVVQRQVVADVPVGVFLSGGVDSSILTALCADALGPENTKAFTLGYSGFNLNYNEVDQARAVARHLGVKHFVYEATASDLIHGLERMVWHYDEPFGDAASLNMMALSGLVRSEVTVALAGEGSDEIFGGYRRYQVERLIRRLGPFAELAQSLVRVTGIHTSQRLPRRLAILLRSMSHRSAGRRYSAYFESGVELEELIRPEWRSDFDPRLRLEELYPDDLGGRSPVAALCEADQQFWLVDTYLEKSDKGAMAHSLEVRVPFLDNEIVEFANSLPDDLRINGRSGKLILKEAFKGTLPQQVFTRTKRGFGVPIAHWLRADLKDYFADHVLSPASRTGEYLERAVIERYFNEHQDGRHDRSLILWYVLLFETWLRLVEKRFEKPQ